MEIDYANTVKDCPGNISCQTLLTAIEGVTDDTEFMLVICDFKVVTAMAVGAGGKA